MQHVLAPWIAAHFGRKKPPKHHQLTLDSQVPVETTGKCIFSGNQNELDKFFFILFKKNRIFENHYPSLPYRPMWNLLLDSVSCQSSNHRPSRAHLHNFYSEISVCICLCSLLLQQYLNLSVHLELSPRSIVIFLGSVHVSTRAHANFFFFNFAQQAGMH